MEYLQRYYAKNEFEKFYYELNEFRIGVFMKNEEGENVWIFRYPEFLKNRILNENEIILFTKTLNGEVEKHKMTKNPA